MIYLYLLLYSIPGLISFVIYHRVIRLDDEPVEAIFVSTLFFLLWPIALFCFLLLEASLLVEKLGNKIKNF